MADRTDLLRPNPTGPLPREEGELSSGGEDENLLPRPPNLQPSPLSLSVSLTTNADKTTNIGAIATSSQRSNPTPLPIPLPTSNPNPNPNLPRFTPHTIPHSFRTNNYNKRMQYNKPPNTRNLSWQKKRPLDDQNLVISFSDDESESDTHTTPTRMHSQLRPQLTRSGATSSIARNSILGPNGSAHRPNTPLQTRGSSSPSNGALATGSDKVLETLRQEIALREQSLKIQKMGSVEATDGRAAKRTKVEPPSNGNHSAKDDQLQFSACPSGNAKGEPNQFLSHNSDENKSVSAPYSGMVLSKADNSNRESNGRFVLGGVHRSVDVVMQSDTSAWLNQNAENTDNQAQLQLLLEQEDAQDRELEQAQELRRRLEREEREAFKAYRKAQQALFEANEKCNFLQKKRDLLSNKVNSLLENSSTSNTPWPLCWHDPRESPSDQPADGPLVAVSHNDNREEGQLTDSTNSKDQEEEAVLSEVDRRGTPSGNSSPQDYEALEASLRSELVARYSSKALVNSAKSAERDVIDQTSAETQENLSPNKTQTLPFGTMPITHSAGGNSFPSKDFSESAEKEMINEENLPFGVAQDDIPLSTNRFHELPHPVNASVSNTTSVSFEESNQTLSKFITEPAVKKPGEIVPTSLKTTNELADSHLPLPPSIMRNACVHFKQMIFSFCDGAHNARHEGMDELEQARENTGSPQVDPFWPFCIFELRGRCNDEECRWQHVKAYEWRKFKPDTSLTAPSGRYQHVVQIPTYRIGSCLIKERPCSVQPQGLWQYWQRGFCALFPVPVSVKRFLPIDTPDLLFPEAPVAHLYDEISSSNLLLEEDLPESEKCLESAFNLSCGKQKVLSTLSRALERDPKSVLIWIVYLHIYYMKEKDLGKDDMFLDAVYHNKYSYDLWLMYINSRIKLEDQLNAFTNAITTMCQLGPTLEKEKKDQSSIILDLYLRMVNTLCMSGCTEMAISRVFKFSSDELLTAILSTLVVPDKCIFWVTSIYLSIYGQLPVGILEQLELEKDLNLVIDWPSVNLRTDDEVRVSGLFNHACIDIGLIELDPNSPKTDGKYLKELHFVAISHVKCMAAVQGLNGATNLLVKYKEIFPTCVELALILARLEEKPTYDSNQVVVSNGFEVAISHWPRQSEGLQCIWNQYAEHLLASKKFDLARDLLSRWYGESKLEAFIDTTSESHDSIPRKEHLFGLLNLCLYQLLQDDLSAAHLIVDKALKLADQEFYKHCLTEHVTVHLLKESLVNKRDVSSQVILHLIGSYLKDAHTSPFRKVLSRKYYQDIKKIRTRRLLDEWLGPVSDDYSLINSILEMCYGKLFIPEKSGIKELVNLVESVTQISPANYRFALSVCRFAMKNFGFDDTSTMSIRLWAGSILVNSIFRSVPVAPEPVWVEGAEVLVDLKLFEMSNRFLEQAVSVYPFSLKLWHLYLSRFRGTNEMGDRIVEAARSRGIELLA
ncbi:zinc finger C3H1 domain protein [Rhynchospora pubera]|uniref:Zinc finger C3H1 domain protein n=1 Tax=Rhynchospora pubera TaxID=906938 RepID=A0AAV8DYL0_9POAL|nr:zinc finger C3H1 domain protein [Rhynchospora pubera]